MKNLIKTAVIGIALTASVASCSKSETTSNNNSQTQLSANQMLLLGTTNPNDANASASWALDSVWAWKEANNNPEYSMLQVVGTTDVEIWTFTTDSITYMQTDGFSQTLVYRISNDTIYSDRFTGGWGVVSFESNTQLRTHSINAGNPDLSGAATDENLYFTKQ